MKNQDSKQKLTSGTLWKPRGLSLSPNQAVRNVRNLAQEFTVDRALGSQEIAGQALGFGQDTTRLESQFLYM